MPGAPLAEPSVLTLIQFDGEGCHKTGIIFVEARGLLASERELKIVKSSIELSMQHEFKRFAYCKWLSMHPEKIKSSLKIIKTS